MSKVCCSLCDQEFDTDDTVLELRQKRHEDKHTRGWNYKSQSNGGGNNTVGKVTWRIEN